MATLSRERAEALLDAPKVADSTEAVDWQHARVAGVTLTSQLVVGVAAKVGRSSVPLVVYGEHRPPGHLQLHLRVPPGNDYLARLCLTPIHGDDLHWHLYGNACTGIEVTEPVSQAVDILDHNEVLMEVFVKRLHITGLSVSGEFNGDGT